MSIFYCLYFRNSPNLEGQVRVFISPRNRVSQLYSWAFCWLTQSQSYLTTDCQSQFLRLRQPGGPSPCIYIPQEQGGPVIPLGTEFPFRRLLQLAELCWRYSNPASTWRVDWLTVLWKLKKLKLNYDQQSVGQSVLVLDTHLGSATNFSFSFKFSLDSCGFVIL
jgi:hypothetical protein